MNKKLVILSCLIVFAFGVQTAFMCYEYIIAISSDKGEEPSKERAALKSYITLPVRFTSDRATPDTLMVYNDKAGARMPVKVEQVSVEVERMPLSLYYMLPLGLLVIAFIIVACVQFYKLIISVARSKIFEWSNVRRLRYIGGILIAFTLLDLVLGLLLILRAKEYISVSGYHLGKELDAIPLILGLFFLLVAEIFAKGLRLKEEQELTI
ncbi:MAG: DUF2975 domain-containing protein [Tannerellaceae bacterium]|jgi:hypothetical protein|nr:DUF2975 domain-containing protein [Tannerellaceae bacterium]